MLRTITDKTLKKEIRNIITFVCDATDGDFLVYTKQPGFENFGGAESARACFALREKCLTLFHYVRNKRKWTLEDSQIYFVVDEIYRKIPLL